MSPRKLFLAITPANSLYSFEAPAADSPIWYDACQVFANNAIDPATQQPVQELHLVPVLPFADTVGDIPALDKSQVSWIYEPTNADFRKTYGELINEIRARRSGIILAKAGDLRNLRKDPMSN